MVEEKSRAEADGADTGGVSMLAKAKHSVSAYQRETVPFLGLNRSDNTQEGEFSEQKNMSDRRHPFLAPRLPRSVAKKETAPDALFHWDGHEIVAAGGALYLDGEACCNVTSGPKQFAVVNTKLVVWPDRITVDLTNRQVEQMHAKAVNAGGAAFGKNCLTLLPQAVYAWDEATYIGWNAYMWTYTSVRWDAATKTWSTAGKAKTNVFDDSAIVGKYYIPTATYNSRTNSYSASRPDIAFNGAPEESMNSYGVYGKVEKTYSDYADINGKRQVLSFGIYRSDWENGAVDELFAPGDIVTISGAPIPGWNREDVKVTGIDADSNTLTFADGAFYGGCAYTKTLTSGTYYCVRYTDSAGEEHYYKTPDTNLSNGAITNTKITIASGEVGVLNTDESMFYVVRSDGTLARSYKMTACSASSGVLYLTWAGALTAKVTVERRVPELDYICEHENRLWGVSNSDKTIYASALGDPNNFYDYSGDAGSYAVAVGSEGGFTGICSYGNAVLCWKERTLHKVLGDLPSNYQTAVYRFAGVRDGAHKSLVNVNETLFFLGVDGVYAFSGNKPSLVSRQLGTNVLKDGVGGTDGKAYYLSAKNGEEWEILTYDTHNGLWTRSDETQVVDFARSGDELKFLSGDAIYTIGAGDESVEWEAVFVPMYETLEGGKQYNRLIFRVEVPKGGYMAADVRFDDGRWIQVGIVKGKSGPVHMPVPLRRCDKFQIRLRGKGDCAVLDMVREFRLRGGG